MEDRWIELRAEFFYLFHPIKILQPSPHLFYCHNLHLDDEFLQEFCLEFGLNSVFDLFSISFTSY